MQGTSLSFSFWLLLLLLFLPTVLFLLAAPSAGERGPSGPSWPTLNTIWKEKEGNLWAAEKEEGREGMEPTVPFRL